MNPVDIALPVVGGLALEDEWASRPASSSIPSSNPILADSGKDLDPIDYDEVDWYYPPDVGSSNSDVSYLDLNETVEELLLYETGYGSDNNSDVSHLDLDNGGEEESGDSYALATLSGVVRNCGLGHDKENSDICLISDKYVGGNEVEEELENFFEVELKFSILEVILLLLLDFVFGRLC